MKLNSPIDIDLLTFFKTGKFDYLKLGQTKDWIINNFADPDSFNFLDSKDKMEIWNYGNIELHFDNQVLFLIYTDYIDDIDGGESLKLDKWILSEPNKLTLKFVIENLIAEKIDFQLVNDSVIKNYIRLSLIESKVQFTFIGEDKMHGEITDRNLFRLASFGLFENIVPTKNFR